MKATIKESAPTVNLRMKESGADVLQSAFRYSKTIGRTVAQKEGLSGDDAAKRAGEIQRTLRRVRVALESAGA